MVRRSPERCPQVDYDFRFTLYSTLCVVGRAPRGPRERWLQVLDGMRRQRGIRACSTRRPRRPQFRRGAFMMSGGYVQTVKGMNHRITAASAARSCDGSPEARAEGYSHFAASAEVCVRASREKLTGRTVSLTKPDAAASLFYPCYVERVPSGPNYLLFSDADRRPDSLWDRSGVGWSPRPHAPVLGASHRALD